MNLFIVEDQDSLNVHEYIQVFLPNILSIEVISHSRYNEPGVSKRINALQPDVVMLNVSRKHEAMICVLENIKDCFAATKVIVLTDYPDKHCEDRCIGTGADYFFNKVFFDEPSVNMRVRAIIQIHAALWHLVNPCVPHDRFVTLQ